MTTNPGDESMRIAPRYSSNGFVLNAGCNAGGDPLVTITGTDASAKTVAADANAVATTNVNGDFPNVDVIAAQQQGTGQIVYALSGGTVLTVDYAYADTNTFNNEPVCSVHGTVTVG